MNSVRARIIWVEQKILADHFLWVLRIANYNLYIIFFQNNWKIRIVVIRVFIIFFHDEFCAFWGTKKENLFSIQKKPPMLLLFKNICFSYLWTISVCISIHSGLQNKIEMTLWNNIKLREVQEFLGEKLILIKTGISVL